MDNNRTVREVAKDTGISVDSGHENFADVLDMKYLAQMFVALKEIM